MARRPSREGMRPAPNRIVVMILHYYCESIRAIVLPYDCRLAAATSVAPEFRRAPYWRSLLANTSGSAELETRESRLRHPTTDARDSRRQAHHERFFRYA